MALPPWEEQPIAKSHDRSNFDCGDTDLNQFLQLHARRGHEKNSSKTYLAVAKNDLKILGFYSLCPATIAYSQAPKIVKRGLARHKIPVFRLARLAVDKGYEGVGLGGQLLLAASRRCISVAAQVGGVALLIDAKNQQVASWYKSYGAIALNDKPLSLILPLKTAAKALNQI